MPTLHNATRRSFLAAVTAGMGAAAAFGQQKLQPANGDVPLIMPRAPGKLVVPPKVVKIVNFDATGKRTEVVEVPKIVKTDAEWHKQLNAEQFDITRKQGTEPSFSGKYWNLHDDGLYSCICCATTLFDSKTKYESGTGWPSFFQPIAKENVTEHVDRSFGETRTEVECARCDAHLGHVFDDGPKPTGLRYCMDSASLNFTPRGKA